MADPEVSYQQCSELCSTSLRSASLLKKNGDTY